MPLEPIKRAEKLSHIMFRKLLYFGCPTNSVWARSYDHLKINGMSEPDPFINQWREIPWIVWKFLDFRAISWRKTPFKMIVRPSYFVSRLYSSPPPILKVWTSYDNSKSVKSHIFIQNVGHDRPQMTVLAWTLRPKYWIFDSIFKLSGTISRSGIVVWTSYFTSKSHTCPLSTLMI